MDTNITQDILGILAGTLTTVSFLPQVIKTYRSRNAAHLSLGMFLLFTLGVFLWLLYGVSLGKLPMIIANGVTLVLAGSLLFAKFMFKQSK
ncbi:MAG: SemiSWEET transporter [Chitinispirillales bacterium]|jgi:MtN3 and saliva related transmembrane protein|nr:SemiSWEET transporter [Chitinispirillales bacterium]